MPPEVDRILLLGDSTTIGGLNSPRYLEYAVEPAGVVEVVLSPDNSNALLVTRSLGAACVLMIDRRRQVEIRGYRVVAYEHHRRTEAVIADARRALAAAGRLDEGRRRCCALSPRAPGCLEAPTP